MRVNIMKENYFDKAIKQNLPVIPVPYKIHNGSVTSTDIPDGYDLCIAEYGDEEETALILHGWNEVDDEYLTEEFKNPIYVFISNGL